MPSLERNVRFVSPPTLPPSAGYSHVAEATRGRTIYVSGQVALDPVGNLVGKGDLRAQTHQVFLNLKAALEAAGADFSSVVKLTYYLRDISGIQVVRQVRDQFVNTTEPPASSAIEVSRLVRDEFLVEIDAVAVVPDAA